MKRIKLGIIGIGEIAQLAHLPVLEDMSEQYELRAFCDVSKELLTFMGKKYNVKNLYTEAVQMFEQEDLDAVFVLSGLYNAALTVEAAKRGIHVFVEKPMAYTPSQVDDIIKAKNNTGIHVMVGYMRRYAPAFLQAAEEIKKIKNIKYVKVRDIIGENSFFTGQSKRSYRFNDIPEEIIENRNRERARLLNEVSAASTDELKRIYSLLLGLCCHSISAMRELIGMPKNVDFAVNWSWGYMNTLFNYDSFKVSYEIGLDCSL